MKESCWANPPEDCSEVHFIEESFETDADLAGFRFYLKELLKKGEVKLRFQKKDLTLRDMRCTINPNLIPDDKKPVEKTEITDKKLRVVYPYQFRVFDLDANDWRSFNSNTLVSLNLFNTNSIPDLS